MDRILTRIFTVSAVAVVLVGGGALTALADDPVAEITTDVQATSSEITATVDDTVEPVDEVTSEVVTKVDDSIDTISNSDPVKSTDVQSAVETDSEAATPSTQSPATGDRSQSGPAQPSDTSSDSVGTPESGTTGEGNGTVVQRREPTRGKKSKKDALDQLVSVGNSIKAPAGPLNAAQADIETEVLDTAIIKAEESTAEKVAQLALTGIDPMGHLVIALSLIAMGIQLTRSRPRRKGSVVVIDDERARLIGARLAAI